MCVRGGSFEPCAPWIRRGAGTCNIQTYSSQFAHGMFLVCTLSQSADGSKVQSNDVNEFKCPNVCHARLFAAYAGERRAAVACTGRPRGSRLGCRAAHGHGRPVGVAASAPRPRPPPHCPHRTWTRVHRAQRTPTDESTVLTTQISVGFSIYDSVCLMS